MVKGGLHTPTANMGALIIRIWFWGRFFYTYNYNKEPPKYRPIYYGFPELHGTLRPATRRKRPRTTFNVGALIVRLVFWDHYTILIIRNPQNQERIKARNLVR